MENFNEFFIHEFVVIGDSQNDGSLSLQGTPVALIEFGAVMVLHHKNEIRPADLFVAGADLGVAAQAC